MLALGELGLLLALRVRLGFGSGSGSGFGFGFGFGFGLGFGLLLALSQLAEQHLLPVVVQQPEVAQLQPAALRELQHLHLARQPLRARGERRDLLTQLAEDGARLSEARGRVPG